MSEVIIALLRTECGDEGADPAREARNSSLGCFSEMRFQFAERLLDRIIWGGNAISHRPLQSILAHRHGDARVLSNVVRARIVLFG